MAENMGGDLVFLACGGCFQPLQSLLLPCIHVIHTYKTYFNICIYIYIDICMHNLLSTGCQPVSTKLHSQISADRSMGFLL